MNRSVDVSLLALLAAVVPGLASQACRAPEGAAEPPPLVFPLPEDPLAPNHPFPAARQVGPSGLALPSGALEAFLPPGEDGDRARALMARMRENVRDLDGVGVTAVLRAPFTGEIDASTVASEVDVLTEAGERAAISVGVSDHTLEIRPRRPWDSGARYVALVRQPRDRSGASCVPSAGVRALAEDHPGDAFDAERAVVRAALGRAGIPMSNACLAFSFRVQDVMGKVRALRDRVGNLAAQAPPAFALGEVHAAREIKGLEASHQVDRVIYGTFDSPSFRDADGRFVAARLDGEAPPAERLRVAISLPAKGKAPYPVVLGIHGLGGDIASTLPLYAEYLGEAGFAYVTIDGVEHGSRATPGKNAYTSIFDLDDPHRSRDVLRQTLADLYQLRQLVSRGVSLDGKGDLLDRAHIGWSGGSYGGIFGTMLAATDPGIEAAHVEACGAPWRDVVHEGSVGLGIVQLLFSGKVGLTPADAAFAPTLTRFLELAQWIVDPGDASALAEYAARRPLDGERRARLLMQYWVGETLMPNAASEELVRALSIPLSIASRDPSGVRAVWPIEVAKWGAPGGLDGHGAFWKIAAARRQALAFLASGGTEVRAPEDFR